LIASLAILNVRFQSRQQEIDKTKFVYGMSLGSGDSKEEEEEAAPSSTAGAVKTKVRCE